MSKYWPEYGQLGKENTTLADVLRHEAGLTNFCQTVPWESLSREAIKENAIGKIIEQTECDNPKQLREYHSVTR